MHDLFYDKSFSRLYSIFYQHDLLYLLLLALSWYLTWL